MAYRTLAARQRAQIWIGGPAKARADLLFETDEMLIEAPNWSLDGSSLYLNANGALWRLALDAPERELTRIDFDGLPELNNDHVLDPDGEHIYMSAMDFAEPGRLAVMSRTRNRSSRTRVPGTHRRLVPAPVAGLAIGFLHRLSARHARPPRRSRRRGAGGRNGRLVDAAAAIRRVRRPGNDQRQQLGTGQHTVRVRRIPAPGTAGAAMTRPGERPWCDGPSAWGRA
jgi:hypothetical protein